MRLSLQVRYAICGVFDLAYNGHGEPVQVRVISERQGIPTRYLEQIFRRLRQGQIVLSKRGPGGGYTLARPPAEITLRMAGDRAHYDFHVPGWREAPTKGRCGDRCQVTPSRLKPMLMSVVFGKPPLAQISFLGPKWIMNAPSMTLSYPMAVQW